MCHNSGIVSVESMVWWQPLLLHCALVSSNYNQYALAALCQPFSGAFGLHSGATINLGEC